MCKREEVIEGRCIYIYIPDLCKLSGKNDLREREFGGLFLSGADLTCLAIACLERDL